MKFKTLGSGALALSVLIGGCADLHEKNTGGQPEEDPAGHLAEKRADDLCPTNPEILRIERDIHGQILDIQLLGSKIVIKDGKNVLQVQNKGELNAQLECVRARLAETQAQMRVLKLNSMPNPELEETILHNIRMLSAFLKELLIIIKNASFIGSDS